MASFHTSCPAHSFLSYRPNSTQAAQAQYESTCGCVIFKMAFIIKDLHGNSGNRFEKVNTRMNFQ